MSDPRTRGGLARSTALHLILILLLGFLAYSNTFGVPFQFDDEDYIETNIFVTQPGKIFSPLSTASRLPEGNVRLTVFTRYLGHLSFALNYVLGGLEPTGYHAVNLAVHLINALLVYWLVVLTFRTPRMNGSRLGESSRLIALFSALLFVSHPVQTQAVTYLTQRFTSLCAMFYLVSLTLYIKARLSEGRKCRALYLFSFVSALTAMFTKEIAFTLPVAIALYEFMFLESGLKGRVKKLLPYLLLMPIVPILVLVTDVELDSCRSIFDVVAGATTTQHETTRWEYFLTQQRVITTYLRLLVLPINQNLDYDYPVFHELLDPQVLPPFLLLMSVFGLGLHLLRRSSTSEPALRLIAFGIFWFFIAASVESSVIPIVIVISEQRVYLPSAAFFPAFVAGIFYATEKIGVKKIFAVTAAVCIAVAVSFSVAAYSRNAVWKTELSLWTDVVSKSPGNWRGHYNLGNALRDAGAIDKSIEHYQTAIRLKPGKAMPYNNLGIAYKKKGRLEAAVEQYEMAIEADPFYANAYSNLGNVYLAMGLYDKAIGYYETALSLDPDYPDANYNMGVAYHHKGEHDKAIRYYEKALELNPNYVDAHYNLGLVYREKGSIEMARREFEKVLQIEPAYRKAMEKLNELRGSTQSGDIE
jgi:Tfp pilus assembly protein PilF